MFPKYKEYSWYDRVTRHLQAIQHQEWLASLRRKAGGR